MVDGAELILLRRLHDEWFEPLYGLSDSGSMAVKFRDEIRAVLVRAGVVVGGEVQGGIDE